MTKHFCGFMTWYIFIQVTRNHIKLQLIPQIEISMSFFHLPFSVSALLIQSVSFFGVLIAGAGDKSDLFSVIIPLASLRSTPQTQSPAHTH